MPIRLLAADRRMRALLAERGILNRPRRGPRPARMPQERSVGEETLVLALRTDGSIPPFEREYKFWPGRKFSFDLAWLPQRLAVEVDGGHWIGGRHSRSGFESDAIKLNQAVIFGWRVLRFSTEQVKSGYALHTIKSALA